MKKIKIAIILPYKEDYTFEKASAASLWVSEFFKKSKFKKKTYIFGSTKSKNFLTKNYINIFLDEKTSKLFSTTNTYTNKIIKQLKNQNFDLIEIHNRPISLFKISKKINTKIIFYFHNDPLSMSGSISINQRLEILRKTDKIIFVSKYIQNRFFLDLDPKLKNKTDVVYPSVNKQIKILKKSKQIVFVGKLNESKGYDLYKDALIKILNKYSDWKGYSIGDEKRRKIYINHKNHIELGFIEHKQVIKMLKKTEIVVVPSRWNEPFGRTALEAVCCGCATIISNKGGLPETSNHHFILDKLNPDSLFKLIKKLILNQALRKNKQIIGFKNIKHLISENTKLIDSLRSDCFFNPKLNYLKNKLKIINIYNLGQKLNHRLYNISLGKKFTNGFLRNGHDVLEISDRDFKNANANFLFPNNNFQKYLLETFKNYSPNLIFFGHTKNIEIETLNKFKNLNQNLIISHWNEDPIMVDLDYSLKNIKNISYYLNHVDHTFITTSPDILIKNKKINNVHHMFVPVDQNIECYDAYKLKPRNDIFYAMSHGVNRGILKEGKFDSRVIFLDNLIKLLPDIKYDFYGFKNQEPVWANDFYKAMINSKMALNLSRGKPTKYYSSNRIASVMGNGLLTFIDEKVQLQNFFSKNEIVFYKNINDLAEKIIFYSKNDKLRIKIAKQGKNKYFKLFNGNRIAEYIVNISLGKKASLF